MQTKTDLRATGPNGRAMAGTAKTQTTDEAPQRPAPTGGAMDYQQGFASGPSV